MRFAENRKLAEFVSGQDWDSSLWTRDLDDGGNVTLKLRMRLHFRSVEMRTGPNAGYYQEEDDRFGNHAWDDMMFNQWQKEYCRVITDYWSTSFWLLTPEDYKELVMGDDQPNVSCTLEVEPVPTPGGAHYTFNIIRLADYRVNRMFAGGHGYTGWLADVGRGADVNNEVRIVNLKQAAHLLAMPHRGRENANNNQYFKFQAPIVGYGDSTAAQEAEQDRTFHPGQKLGRSVLHARPWQIAMERHSGRQASEWMVTMSRLLAEKRDGAQPPGQAKSSQSSTPSAGKR